MMIDRRPNEVVYEAHAAEVVRFATGLVGPDEAPDVVADAFVRLSSSPVWAEARDRRALWFRAVMFEARSMQRSAIRRRAREARVAVPSTAVVDDPGVADPDVIGALSVLSTQQRAVVFLTYWQDLDPTAIAEALGVSEGSVRKQLARSRKKLGGVLA